MTAVLNNAVSMDLISREDPALWPKILIVDDRPENLFSMKQILTRMPSVVIHTAGSGNEALTLMLKERYALVLLDVQMAGMDGYEVAKIMKDSKELCEIPLIFVTAVYQDEKYSVKGFEHGAYDFIYKPLNAYVLTSKIQIFIQLYWKNQLLEKANADLAKALDKAQEADRAKAIFIANISHEISTPMSVILGLSEILDLSVEGVQDRELLCRIRRAGRTLLQILEDVLDLAKLGSGKIQSVQAVFSIAKVVEEIENCFLPGKKKLNFRVKVAPEIPAELEGNPVRLVQILLNLLSNAIKYSEKGTITLTVACSERSPSHCFLKFSMSDEGIGIKAADQKKIFEIFEQVQAPATRTSCSGVGLGLAIVRNFVRLLGGEIHLESEPGVGSIFSFTLPFTVHSSTMAPQMAEAGVNETEDAPFRVLVVEDDEDIRSLFKKMLKPCQTHELPDGSMVAQTLLENDFDVVLMDIRMPVMGGYESVKTVRALPAHKNAIPVIAITAFAVGDCQEDWRQAGFSHFMRKPVSKCQLWDAIEACCPGHKALLTLKKMSTTKTIIGSLAHV